jgi:holo-[acyl-carrier protein] synthase
MIAGLGIDAVDLARAERMLAQHGDRVLLRLCTEGEATYVRARSLPAQHLAARLAAKEAAFKALAGGGASPPISWRDVEVVSGADGAPTLAFHGAARTRADQLGVTRWHVSLTHSELTAVAVVILER